MKDVIEALSSAFLVVSFNNEGYITRKDMEMRLGEMRRAMASTSKAGQASDDQRKRRADYAAAEVRLRKAKARISPLTHLKEAIDKIPPELAAGLTLAVSDNGEVVQDA